MDIGEDGRLEAQYGRRTTRDEIPGFRFFDSVGAEELAKLPRPGVPFGLELSGNLGSDGWKSLALFKSLRALNCGSAPARAL